MRSLTLCSVTSLVLVLSACHRAPRPDVVGTTGAQAHDLAMDDAAFYWLKRGDASSGKPVSDGAVLTMPKAGGQPTTLASGQFLADHIAIDANDVYWSHSRHEPDKVHNLLSRVPKKGGAVVDLVDGDRGIESLAVDATSIFFASGQAKGRILKLDKSGGTPVELATEQSNPRGMAVDANNVYWVTIETSGSGKTVRKVAKAGGPTVTLATVSDAGAKERLAVDGTGVYFLDGSSLMSVPIAGGAPTLVVDHVGEFAVDGSTVYFNPTNDIYLMKLTRGATKPVPVAYDPGAFPSGLSVDAKSIYWSAPVEQQIRRSNK